jgi:hypothetical protein
MSDFEVPSNYKIRTDSQKNRYLLVRDFMGKLMRPCEGGRINFKDIQKGINAFLAKSASEHIGRIELSRCLGLLKVPIEYYHGAYIPGYEWINKKSTSSSAFRVDPKGYLEEWFGERFCFQHGFSISTNRAHQTFTNWCVDPGYTPCTLSMFVRRMNWLIDPENGKPLKYTKNGYTFWENYITVYDMERFNEKESKILSNTTIRGWCEMQTEKRKYYIPVDERRSIIEP